MDDSGTVHVLVDDERDVAELIRDLLQRAAPGRYAVKWVQTFETGADGSVRPRDAVLVNCLDEPGVKGVVVNLRDTAPSVSHVRSKQPVQMLRATLPQRVTPRETEIIQGLLQYRRLSRVAKLLGISVHTARNHLKSIFRKLNLHSQDELLAFLEDKSPTRADM
jgi:DNA-binding CsgD family transcriptional regulator